MKKSSQGFTVIELLIVIAVIVVLGVLVLATYSGIQAKERNSKRSEDIANVQTQLEFFFQNNGYYPSLADMNSPDWLAKNMKRLDRNYLIDPSSPTNSEKLVATPAPKSYAYSVKDGAGKSCEKDDTNCSQYVLTATFEGTVNGANTAYKTNMN